MESYQEFQEGDSRSLNQAQVPSEHSAWWDYTMALPGNLLEMQVLRPWPTPTESGIQGLGPVICDSEAC